MIKPYTRFFAFTALITVLLNCVVLLPASAQIPEADSIVTRVDVIGLSGSSASEALSMISTAAGRAFDKQIARQDQKRLMDSGLFDDVAVVSSPDGDGLAVQFIIVARAAIQAIEFNGNKHLTDRQLLNECDLKVGQPLDSVSAASAISTIEKHYKKDGYYFVNIELDQKRLMNNSELVYQISEGPRVRVNDVDFKFVASDGAFSKIKLSSLVKSGDGWWIIVPGRLNDENLREDISKLEQFYHDNGYLDAEVTTRLDFSADKSKAQLKFVIDEGQRYVIERVVITGNKVFSGSDLIGRFNMTRGKFFNEQTMMLDSKSIRDAYGRIGFVNAAVTARTIYTDPNKPAPADLNKSGAKAPPLVSVVYEVREGSQYKLGRIEVRGNDVTKDRVIRRLINMHPGDYFDTTAMELSENNLRQCGLFEKATIIPYGSTQDIRDALVEIEEGNTASINVGISASSDSGFSGMLSYRQSNFSWTRWPNSFLDALIGSGFKGDGQTLEMRIEPGVEYSRMRLSWYEPYLMDRNVSLSVGTYAERLDQDDYDQDQSGIDVGLGRSLGGLWYGSVNSGFEYVKIKNLEDDIPSEFNKDVGKSHFGNVGVTLTRDGTDSRWLPGSGGKFTIGATVTGLDYDFLKARTEYKHYFTLHEDVLDRKHILAFRGRMDCIFGDAPYYKRYYGGGLSHVRGFEYRGISPRTRDVVKITSNNNEEEGEEEEESTVTKRKDDPIGGNLLAYLGAEYSFPLVSETVRGLVFIDSGTVERKRKIQTWRVAAGFGISIKMGNIPVIINFAWPLAKQEEDDEELISFSMGWFF